MEHLLCRSDPWKEGLCGREECLMCASSEKDIGRCRKTNIVYKITCRLCREKGKKMEYWGESSRSGYLRGKEHKKALEQLSDSSHMARHMKAAHPDTDLGDESSRRAETWFTMELHEQHTTAMDRQLSEAMAIAKAGGMDSDGVMNSSDEYNRCILPELQSSSEIKMKEREKRRREEEGEEREREAVNKRQRREEPTRAQETQPQPNQNPSQAANTGPETEMKQTGEEEAQSYDQDRPPIIIEMENNKEEEDGHEKMENGKRKERGEE